MEGTGHGQLADSPGAEGPDVEYRQPPLSRRQAIYRTFEDPKYSSLARIISIAFMTLIVMATFGFILEAEICFETANVTHGSVCTLPYDPWAQVLQVVEWICSIAFTCEYLIRLATCGEGFTARLRFALKAVNIIDLIAWLPFWISGAIVGFGAPDRSGSSGGGSFAVVRAIRLLRIFRIFNLGRYALAVQVIGGAIHASFTVVPILLVSGTVSVVLFSSVLYLLENPRTGMITEEQRVAMGRTVVDMGDGTIADPHAACFGTISVAMWWTLTTMTTVGYGDCFPLTTLGKAAAVMTMLSGVVVLGMPISVLGSNFARLTDMYAEDASKFAEMDTNADGMVEERELRQFLYELRQSGRLRVDVDTKIRSLMDKYDSDRDGYITMLEFRNLQQDVVMQPQVCA